MGTNTFNTKSPGDVILSADPNQYKTGLTEDHVPRNTSGVPTDVAGGLGSTLYRWGVSYIQKIFVGVAAREVAIEESGTACLITIGGVQKLKVGVDGFDGTNAKASTFDEAALNFTRTLRVKVISSVGTTSVVIPSDVSYLRIQAWGSGGGGGSNGGGGGSSGASFDVWRPVIPDSTISVITQAGGAGGTGGAAGTNGAATTINVGGLILTASGGIAGDAGGSGGTGGGLAAATIYQRRAANGGTGNLTGANGENSEFAGGGNGAGGAGGGGGGAGYGPGGVGSGGSSPGSDGGLGAGGGGGGGSNAAGGAGGDGVVLLYAWTKETGW